MNRKGSSVESNHVQVGNLQLPLALHIPSLLLSRLQSCSRAHTSLVYFDVCVLSVWQVFQISVLYEIVATTDFWFSSCVSGIAAVSGFNKTE